MALGQGGGNPDTLYYMAWVQYDKAQKEKARELLEAALNIKKPFTMRSDAEDPAWQNQ